MTSDEAREIAIAVLRERAGVLGHPFEEAAAVLEALGPLGSIALPGVAPRTQGEPQANPRCDSCGCETRRRCEACGKVQSSEPQANVEPRGCLCGGPMKCVRCGEQWFMPGQMQKTMDEAQANVEEKKAARLERVWAVHYGNYSPSEVESIWATEELARAHCASLDGSMWEVSWFEVRYALVEASRESASKKEDAE